jgi:hypothetical protein
MLWLFDFLQLDINKLDKKVRNVTAKAKLLTSNSTCDKNPLEQPTFFSCLHTKLLVYFSLIDSEYNRGKTVDCSQEFFSTGLAN